ncbi:MAG: hypothetical protein NTZ92_08130 [Candidatus Omnitrophica bacterium]|nr:hypothetical protein [Candidatus Omnitrophota bacterium]
MWKCLKCNVFCEEDTCWNCGIKKSTSTEQAATGLVSQETTNKKDDAEFTKDASTKKNPSWEEEIQKEAIRCDDGVEKDELYDEAVRVIIESNQASVSILQKRMRLGYTRAARIIDMMEQEGLVGPFEGSKPRKILVDREAWLKNQLNN